MVVKLKVVNGKHAGTTYLVWKSPYIIGRHEQADLRIGNSQVSVYHCCIIIRGTEVWVRDMDSTNGTFVNDERIDGEQRLRIGDCVKAGPAQFEVLQEATGAIPEADRDGYTPTDPAIPAPPKTSRTAKSEEKRKRPAEEDDDAD
jgi:pSer/pThr/pTyr-binding forkhead associated (FHA) protein